MLALEAVLLDACVQTCGACVTQSSWGPRHQGQCICRAGSHGESPPTRERSPAPAWEAEAAWWGTGWQVRGTGRQVWRTGWNAWRRGRHGCTDCSQLTVWVRVFGESRVRGRELGGTRHVASFLPFTPLPACLLPVFFHSALYRPSGFLTGAGAGQPRSLCIGFISKCGSPTDASALRQSQVPTALSSPAHLSGAPGFPAAPWVCLPGPRWACMGTVTPHPSFGRAPLKNGRGQRGF